MEREEILNWNRKYDTEYPWWTQKEKELGDKLRKTKEQLMSVDIVVGKEPLTKGRLTTEHRPKTDKKTFLSDLDDNARPFFEAILATAEEHQLPIHWGSVGFSMNVDVEGTHIAIFMGYPRSSVFSQTIYTYFPSILTYVKDGEMIVESFKQELMQTGLFKSAGNEMKHVIKQRLTEEQIENILKLVTTFASKIQKNGLIE